MKKPQRDSELKEETKRGEKTVDSFGDEGSSKEAPEKRNKIKRSDSEWDVHWWEIDPLTRRPLK